MHRCAKAVNVDEGRGWWELRLKRKTGRFFHERLLCIMGRKLNFILKPAVW